MADWDSIARSRGYESAGVMFRTLYDQQKLSLASIRAQFGVSVAAIRKQLDLAGCSVRPRGGKNNQKLPDVNELANHVRTRGVNAVCMDLGVSYAVIYKALKRGGFTPRGLPQAQQPAEDVPQETSEPRGHDENL